MNGLENLTHPLLRRWCLVLEISGLDVRYYSGRQPPPEKFIDLARAADAGRYVDRCAIAAARPLTSTLNKLRGVVEGVGMELVLGTRGANGDQYDPGRVLGSVGPAGATWKAQITATLESEWLSLAIYVDQDPSGLSYPRRVHIGDETCWVTGYDGDGSEGDPWHFTGVVRGVANTIPRRHAVDLDTGDQPLITSEEIVSWEGRRFVLYVAQAAPDGTWLTTATMPELLRGFIGGQPRIRGSQVTLRLISPAAVVDTELGIQSRPTRLLQGWHRWSGGKAVTVEHLQAWEEGEAWSTLTQGLTNAFDEDLDVVSTDPYDNTFDLTLQEDPPHPRHGRIAFRGAAVRVQPLDPHDVAGDVFQLPAGHPTVDVANGTTVYNAREAEVKAIDLVDTSAGPVLGAWPETLADAINDAAGWVPDDHTGPDGAWANLRLEDGDDVYELVATRNCEPNTNGALDLYFWVSDLNGTPWSAEPPERWKYDAGSGTWVQQRSARPPERLWYAFDLGDPDDDDAPYPSEQRGAKVRAPARRVSLPNGDRLARIRVRGIAAGWYQTGEGDLLVERDPGVVPGTSLSLRIDYYDRADGEVKTHYTRVTASTAVLHPVSGATIGYALTIPEAERDLMPSFGDWPGHPRTVITPIIEWRGAPAHLVLLQALLSTAGQSVSSAAHDDLPLGGGLADASTIAGDRVADVDETSFVRLAAPPGASLWTLRHKEGDTLGDIIAPVLLATGTAIVLRHDKAGRARLARVKLRPPNKVEAAGELRLIRIDEPPESAADTDVRNEWDFEALFDADDEAQLKIRVRDQASIRQHGGYARQHQVSLRGLVLPDEPEEAALQLLPLYSRLFALHGKPRRTWRIVVPTADAYLLDEGSVALVTSPHLWGEDARPGPGVTAVPAMVVHRSMAIDQAGTEMLLVAYGARGTGWNACLQVTATPAANTVTVAANRFRSTPHPVTGLAVEDLDYFMVGDPVRLVPRADHDSAVARTITAINRTTREVTLDGAHGLGALLGYVYPGVYDAPAAAHHQRLAYLAGSDGTLGAAGVEGDEFT